MSQTDRIMPFLNDLVFNNNIEWMHQNKARYQEARAQFETLLQAVIDGVARFDGSVANLQARPLIMRLNRDIRFSHDKSPYNPAFRAHISASGKKPVPAGYFMRVAPLTSFLGAGLFTDYLKDATQLMRRAIEKNPDDWQAMTAKLGKQGFAVSGEKLKRVPKDFDAQNPAAEYLKHKSWYIEHRITDAQALDAAYMAGCFKKMKPLDDYINEVLRDYELPAW